MTRRIVPMALAALTLLLTLPAPLVSAHCPTGGTQTIAGVPFSTCPYNQSLEDISAQISAASGYTVAVVFEKDQGFHPEVATVKSGGTVLLLWLDVDAQEAHQPQSSGPCANGANPLTAPVDCVPSSVGRCFSVAVDNGAQQDSADDVYPLTFRYQGATGLLEKSRGVFSDTPGFSALAAPFRTCPAGSGVNSAGQSVVPYHCLIHGSATTPVKTMRGTIVVLSA